MLIKMIIIGIRKKNLLVASSRNRNKQMKQINN